MSNRCRLLPLAAGLILLLSTAPILAAGITAEQLLDISQVRSAVLSPDGKLAAYTVGQNRALDDEAGRAWMRLHVFDLAAGVDRPFVTGKVSVGAVQFSPDGRFLSFTTKRGTEAKKQIWVMPVDAAPPCITSTPIRPASGRTN